MPSASSKSEKPASSEAVDPLRQAIVILEHKIRNLEKRKTKLDSYKDSVKPLSKDQIEAVSKYKEVLQQLELSKEYVKQFISISNENDKLKKKNAKKEAQERLLADAKKIRQVLVIQEVLQHMGGESTRDDFLTGRYGAVQLTEADLKALDDLYVLLNPKRTPEENTSSQIDQLQKTAELYVSIIEGKQKEIVGMTGVKLKELITSIHNCGYFDQALKEAEKTETHHANENTKEEEPEFREPEEIMSNVIVSSQNPPEGTLPVQNPTPLQPMLQGTPMLPPGTQPPLIQPNPVQMIPPNVSSIVPTPVSQVESTYFNAQGVKPRAPQPAVPPPAQTRQINEVIQSVAGKFNFLRESELEISEMGPAIVPPNSTGATQQIPAPVPAGMPTRTFTNQNFNGQPAGAPAFPPAYPSQPATFQTFVPAFPTFVGPNNSPTAASNLTSTNSCSNSSSNMSSTSNIPVNTTTVATYIPVNTTTVATSTTIDNMKSNNGSIHSGGNLNNTTNKSNNSHSSSMNKTMPNPIPMSTSRNPNLTCNQGQQQMNPGVSMQPNQQPGSQSPNQQGFQHVAVPPNTLVNAPIEETVHSESEKKEKKEIHRQDWNQEDTSNWSNNDWAESSEWKSSNHNEGAANQNKFPAGRVNRNGTGGPRNSNGYQGNRNRSTRQGGYRDQNNQGGGNSNFYQNQNEYQSRTDRSNEYSAGGKGNTDFRDNTFKERGDFNSRDRENYGGGFKRGPNNRGLNMKGPMDRGDRPGQVQRSNAGETRPSRNMNRRANVGNGPSYQRQPPNQGGRPK